MNTSTLLDDRILTVPQIAEYLQLSKSKIYYLISRKQFPHLKLGKNVRVRESDLQKWLNQRIEKCSESSSLFVGINYPNGLVSK